MPTTALIAEDEPLLAEALKAELARAWPDLHIVATVGDGARRWPACPMCCFLTFVCPASAGWMRPWTWQTSGPPQNRFPLWCL
jgi:hypothetical protein